MKIYAISDELLTPAHTIEAQLKEAILGGIKYFQLRDKHSLDSALLPQCARLAEICASASVEFIINDRVELALELQKRGIPCGLHLGRDDEKGEFARLREEFRGIIGISCYGDLERALKYEAQGADYVAFGSIFKSATKVDSAIVGTEILRLAQEKIKRAKICAIGGINAQNLAEVAQADIIAMVSAIWQGDVRENMRSICSCVYLSHLSNFLEKSRL